MKFARIIVSTFLFGLAMPAFSAQVSYLLGDHEDAALYNGSTSGPNGPYGLRMDDVDPPSGNGPTFSVGDNLGGNGGIMTLSWDDSNLAAGALLSGSMYRNDLGGAWTVSYTLTGLVDDGNGGWTATAGTGTATEDGGAGLINFTGKQDTSGYAFIFADDGHRLDGQSDGFVGRGWLQGSGTNDWLVTGNLIPVPAAVWLFASALGLLGWRKRSQAS